MARCRFCGTENSWNAEVCRVCTRPLKKEEDGIETAATEKTERRSRIKQQLTEEEAKRAQAARAAHQSWAPQLEMATEEEQRASLPQYMDTFADIEQRNTDEQLKYGNTSGMGAGKELPTKARDWTWAGVVPLGLFAFYHKDGLGGLLGILLYPVYIIYIGAMGRRIAWRNRRFESIKHWIAVMQSWNTWGLGLLLGVLAVALALFSIYVWIEYRIGAQISRRFF